MIFIAVLEYAILASTFTIAKVAIGYAHPLFLIGVRMLASAPIMFLIDRIQNNRPIRIKKKDFILFISAGLFHVFLPFIGEFWALQYVSSAKTAIIYSLTPFIAAILSYFLLQKKLTFNQMLGLIIGLLGLMPIFFSADQVSFAGDFLSISLPEIVLLSSVIFASYAWFIVSKLMSKGYGISLINGVAMFLGGLGSLFLWYVLSGDKNPIHGDMADFLLWTSLLILVANVISYNIYGWLLKHLSINMMSALGFLSPIFASIYGAILLKEEIGISHFIALFMVIIGLFLFYKDEVRRT